MNRVQKYRVSLFVKYGFLVRAFGLAALFCSFAACNNGVITFTGGNARIRVFNGQVKSASMSVAIDTLLTIAGLANGELSNDISLTSGLYHSFLCRSLSDTSVLGVLANQRYMFADNASYTMVVHGSNITDFLRPVLDSTQSPFPSKAAIRIINATDTAVCNVHVDTVLINDVPADIQSATRLFAVTPGRFEVYTTNHYAQSEIEHRNFNFIAGRVYNLIIYDAMEEDGIVQKVKLIEVN